MTLRRAGLNVANYRLINFKKGVKNDVDFIGRNNPID